MEGERREADGLQPPPVMPPSGGRRVARVRSVRPARLLPFVALLVAVALFTRADVFLYLLYALLGVYLLGRLWARHSLASVTVARLHDTRAFLGQRLPVEVEVRNRGWLPVLWLHLTDSLPLDLGRGEGFRQVLSLLPRESARFGYPIYGSRRGYFRFGALAAQAGDLLGLTTYESRHAQGDYVIVYPKIVPLPHVALPSQAPLGPLPSRQRLFSDPTRIRGVREYQPGDSLRHMDWKTSARVGQLQVRRFEPAIALETALYLNLCGDDYPAGERQPATELGIVIAASLAVHVAQRRQAVGLVTNGRDPLREVAPSEAQSASLEAGAPGGGGVGKVAPRKGWMQAMHLLDLLARVELARGEEAVPFLELLGRESVSLPWGSTVVAITGREAEGLLEALLALRRRGLEVVLVLTCPGREFDLTCARAGQIGVRAVRIGSERELKAWRL